MSKNRGGSRTNNRKGVTAASVTVAVIALLFIAALAVNSAFIRRSAVAMEIDGTKFTSAEYQYFYVGARINYENEIYSNYSSMASSLLPDSSLPLESQTNPLTGQNWAEFYDEYAMELMKTFAGAYKEAQAAGFTVPDEDYATVDAEIDTMAEQVKEYYDMSLGKYLKQRYGSNSGVNEKLYREMSRRQYLVSKYTQSVNDAFVYTAEEIDAKYAENKDGYDYFGYRYFVVSAETIVKEDYADNEEYEAALAEAVEKARTTANGYAASIADEEGFIEAAREYDEASYEADGSTLFTTQGSQLQTACAEWLKDASRRPGDICSVPASEDEASNTQFYVVYFGERYDNEYPTVNVQLIYLAPDTVSAADYTGEDGVLDEDAYNTAIEGSEAAVKAEAEELYAGWQSNGGTQEYLDGLLEEHTHEEEEEFTHSINGGLYENIRRSYNDEDVLDQWMHDSSRREGDTTLLQTDDGNWYLIYFVGFDADYCDYLAETDLRSESMTAWEDTFLAKEAVFRWGMRLL